MRPYLIVFAVSAVVSFVATAVFRRVALRYGAVDVPDDRKVHREPTPTSGGVGMYVALLASVAVAWMLPEFRDLFRTSSEPLGVIGAATVLVALGLVDDTRGMRAPSKLAGQMTAAGILVLAGVQIFYAWIPGLGVLSLSSDLAALLTVLWTIAVINAVNLTDGLDGLAVGVAIIAATAFFVYARATSDGQHTTAELLTVIVAGSGLGFLKHNFNPATIFMGDAGSMLLGLLLASATVSGFSRTIEPQFIDVAGYVVPALLPVFVLAIPLADAGMAILRRVRGRRPVFHADKEHIHHWLLEMARSHRQAVLVMYLWSAMLATAAVVLALGPGIVWRMVSVSIAIALVVSIVVFPRLMRHGLQLPGEEEEDTEESDTVDGRTLTLIEGGKGADPGTRIRPGDEPHPPLRGGQSGSTDGGPVG